MTREQRLQYYSEQWKRRPGTPHASDPDHWDSRADSFSNRKAEEYENPHVPAKYFMDVGMIDARSRVLDIGCGPGGYSVVMAKGCARVVGVDISPRMIAHARELAAAQGVDNAEFLVADFCDADLDTMGWRGAFDMVFASFCPAIRGREALVKMCATSRKWCYLGSYTARASSIHDEIRAALSPDGQPLFSQDTLYYAFNILLAMGQYPRVEYRDNEWKRACDVDSMLGFYSRMYAVQDADKLARARECLARRADAQGLLRENLTSRVAWLYWDVTEGPALE